VSIERDRWGIPHIVARRRDDLWLGFGYAMAQDRLFQMDYLRRKGLGRLAEVLGPGSLLPAGSDRARRGDPGSGRRRGPATRARPEPARSRSSDTFGRSSTTTRLPDTALQVFTLAWFMFCYNIVDRLRGASSE
jgi:hypothetical protein